MDCEKKKVDALGGEFAKEILGVRKSCCTNGALMEVGRIPTSEKLAGRVVGYFAKLKLDDERPLKKACIEAQLEKQSNTWARKVADLISELGVTEYMSGERDTFAVRKVVEAMTKM